MEECLNLVKVDLRKLEIEGENFNWEDSIDHKRNRIKMKMKNEDKEKFML